MSSYEIRRKVNQAAAALRQEWKILRTRKAAMNWGIAVGLIDEGYHPFNVIDAFVDAILAQLDHKCAVVESKLATASVSYNEFIDGIL